MCRDAGCACAHRTCVRVQAIADVVTEAMTYIPSLPDVDARVELITTLRTVTEGKVCCARAGSSVGVARLPPCAHGGRAQIYAEVERARLTKQLAAIREGEGKIAQASELLQEVTVETFGSMEKREKAEFLLEQVRLTQAQGDFVRMGILANKVNTRVLDEVGMEDLRLRYYDLRIALNQQRRDSYALCKDYQAVLATRGFADDASKWTPALQSSIIYLALSPYNHEVSDLLHRIKLDKRTEDLPAYRALLNFLCTDELVPWPLPSPHHDTLRAHAAFSLPAPAAAAASAASAASGVAGLTGPRLLTSSIVRKEDEDRVSWWDVFAKRIVQHNIRTIAKWYTRVTATQLAELLGLNAITTEAVLGELIASKSLYGRIDRPSGECRPLCARVPLPRGCTPGMCAPCVQASFSLQSRASQHKCCPTGRATWTPCLRLWSAPRTLCKRSTW